MTDREMMLKAEYEINELVSYLDQNSSIDPAALRRRLADARDTVHHASHGLIDYQVVVDNLDSSVLIADADSTVLYINKSYETNYNISRGQIIGYKVTDLLKSKKYSAAAVVPEVIKTLKPATKISYLKENMKPSIIFGVPIFNEDGSLKYVVATNREISDFTDLNENFHEFIQLLDDAYSKTQSVRIYNTSKESDDFQEMIGNSAAMKSIHTFVKNLSKTDATVLITGESGTGKELVADAIYRNSGRSNKPYIKINCASIPVNLLESELFGYEKGAFRGTKNAGKTGLFEAANNGTLFLDEIGDMPLDLQAKLLCTLQTNEITRIGGTKPIKLNIRIIASTNSNLKQKIKNGTFRSDLYYRLHVIPINIPPLRERKEDIPLLCESYLKMFADKYGASAKLSQDNYKTLMNYSWPGNIRELKNVMEYLSVCCSGLQSIDNSILKGIFNADEESAAPAQSNKALPLNEAISNYEKEYLSKIIKNVRNLKEASKILEVDISTVSRKLRHYGLFIKHR
jgi:transcriptional regulator with PAS, ATPase and Fis domain